MTGLLIGNHSNIIERQFSPQNYTKTARFHLYLQYKRVALYLGMAPKMALCPNLALKMAPKMALKMVLKMALKMALKIEDE